jgi:glycosyltransferase involved in cell wall biosynthesis
MKVLFVLYTLPNLSQSSIASDIVNEFKNNGHEVYPMAPINTDSKRSYISIENDIEVLRIRTLDVFSENIVLKGLANLLLSFQFQSVFNLFWKSKVFDLIIVMTPSVMFADFISRCKKNWGCKVYLMQKDIFPQNAVDLGFLRRNSIVYNFFKKKEDLLLKTADIVGCTSPGNVNYFTRNYPQLNPHKIKLLFNASKLFCFNVESKLTNDFSDRLFKVVFGGNLGKPQQMENVLQLAQNVQEFDDIVFFVISKGGTERRRFEKLLSQMDLKNVQLLDNLSREDYFTFISSCNLGLISLHMDFTVPNTPMKLNDYLNAGLPVFAIIDRYNDLGELLINNNMGRFAYADSTSMIYNQFISLYRDRDLCTELGKFGFDFCFNNLSTEKSYLDILEHISDTMKERKMDCSG